MTVEFSESPADARGAVANQLSDVMLKKQVDLAQVRRALLDEGAHELLDTLDRLMDLIEPYLTEGSEGE